MFLVLGSDNEVRVDGCAFGSADPEVTGQFEKKGSHPRTVTVVTLDEACFQCAKAVMRAKHDFDEPARDQTCPDQAKDRMR